MSYLTDLTLKKSNETEGEKRKDEGEEIHSYEFKRGQN